MLDGDTLYVASGQADIILKRSASSSPRCPLPEPQPLHVGAPLCQCQVLRVVTAVAIDHRGPHICMGKVVGVRARPLQKRTARNISRWGPSVDDDGADDKGECGQDDATACGVGEGNDERTITMRRAMLTAVIMVMTAIHCNKALLR